jgi:hypothetical protein
LLSLLLVLFRPHVVDLRDERLGRDSLLVVLLAIDARVVEQLVKVARVDLPPRERPLALRTVPFFILPLQNGRFLEMKDSLVSDGGWKENGESYPPPIGESEASLEPYPDDERTNSENP